MLDKIFAKIEKFVPLKWRWVLGHEGFKRYFANTGWMFAGQWFSLLIAFFIGAWIARYLGPENYGILNYAIAFAGLFSFIANLGIDQILSRELVKSPEKRDELLGTGFKLKIIGGLIAFSAASLSAFLVETDYLTRILIIVFSASFILQAINVISLYFQAEVRAKDNVKVQFLTTLISSFLKIGVILTSHGIFWLLLVFTLDFLWQGIGFIKIYRQAGLRISAWKFNQELAREFWRGAWPLMLSGAAVVIYAKIDQVLIGFILGPKEVGLYASAVKLAEVWYFIPSIICASLFPAIINAKKIGVEIYQHRLKNLYILLVALAVLIALIVTVLAKPIVVFLFGREYLAASGVLQIYIWSSVGLFWGWALSQYLIAENLIKTIFLINFLAMIINVGLNFLFIPRLGISGAAYATLVAYFAVPVLFFSFRRYLTR